MATYLVTRIVARIGLNLTADSVGNIHNTTKDTIHNATNNRANITEIGQRGVRRV